MKKIFIKYNPYKLETEMTVAGKVLKENSELRERIQPGSRLQEWVEDLPRILREEYNDTEFEILFHGTLLDYEDLTAVITTAHKNGLITGGSINRKPAKETTGKEGLIDAVFREIQQGPFEELQADDLRSAFQQAQSSDFEVCVVATMSAGKSTLINAMLGTKLMPSKQEACTAIITRIKDVLANNPETSRDFRAEVYDQSGALIETQQKLDYPTMERLNANTNVSVIEVLGNIPFVSSEDISLVLIDTPGPNNARDSRHKEIQSELLGKSSKALVLYVMTGEFGTEDDNALIKRVADSLAVGGKQSKDRFIFVVNKLDDRKKEDGEVSDTLERVRSYLKQHGIVNPNLFPAAALPALNLRLMKSDAAIDDDTIDETIMKVRKLNRNESLHFEKYASLPPSLRGALNNQIQQARLDWEFSGNDKLDNAEEALIHTGVVSIEAAIRQYVQKYAKTAKIKNIADTFTHRLDELACFEKTKNEIAMNQEKQNDIVASIENVRRKINDAQNAQKFKKDVDLIVKNVKEQSNEAVENIIQKFQARIRSRINKLRGEELSIEAAQYEAEDLINFAKQLEPDFLADLENLIRNRLLTTTHSLFDQYKNKLSSLSTEINTNQTSITIDPLRLMGGSIGLNEYSIRPYIQEEERIDRTETYLVKEEMRGWFESLLFWPKQEWVTKTHNIYKTVQYVDGGTLADDCFKDVIRQIEDNGESALRYSVQQSQKISNWFVAECQKLDEILQSKLAELERYATDKKNVNSLIQESQRKLKWLEQIKIKVDSILEI